MGIFIACEMLRRGCRVSMFDASAFRRHSVHATAQAVLLSHHHHSLNGPEISKMLGKLQVASDVEGLVSDAFLVVVEAVSEDLEVKRQVFTSLINAFKNARVPPEKVLLSSNSMSITIDSIVHGLDDEYANRCIGLRFLHPVLFLDEVEVVQQLRKPKCTLRDLSSMLASMRFNFTLSDEMTGRRLTRDDVQSHWDHQHVDVSIPARRTCAPLTSENVCAVCFEQCASTILIPCGHDVTCESCVAKLSLGRDAAQRHLIKCPLCRQDGTAITL